MSCGTLQGYALDCKDSIGGINSVRILQWDYIDTSASGVITSSSGVITTLTPSSSKKFAKYVLPPQNKYTFSQGDPKSNPENGTLYYEQMLKFGIRKLQAALRDEITLLGQNRLAIIVEDQNGKFWLLGEKKGLEMIDSTANSGADRPDFNGYELNFMGKEPALAQEVSSTIIAELTQ